MKTGSLRFFTYCYNEDEIEPLDIVEITENQFINLKGVITYERHTMFENGVNQICLSIEPDNYSYKSELGL